MYTKSRHKRRRIRQRNFFELIVLPFIISLIILMFIVWVMIDVLGIRFASSGQLVLIVIGIALLVGGSIFALSRMIIKKILHHLTIFHVEMVLVTIGLTIIVIIVLTFEIFRMLVYDIVGYPTKLTKT